MSDFDQTIENSSLKLRKDSFGHWKGNKYPEVKLRGFYSDIASVDNAVKTGIIDQASDVTHSHAWQVQKEKHVPLVHENINPIDSEKFSKLLQNQIHGATTEIIKITDFNLNGYLPKCFIPFYTSPGSLPRKVQIDRLKRLYLSMDICEQLEKKNLQPDKLMPKHRPADEVIILNSLSQDPAPFPPFLPLHYFDNEEYEIWTPTEWLKKGIEDNVYKPLPGRALLPDIPSNLYNDPKDPKLVYNWYDVGVIDFDEKKKCWLVHKLSGDERVLDENGTPIVNKGIKANSTRTQLPNQFWIPRIQLQFLAEDPRVFANRIEAAYNERKKTEAYLRYQFYIDSMPNEGMIDLDQVSFKRMLNLTENPGLKTLPEKNKEDSVISLEKEINIDFKRTLNKIIFDKIITSHSDAFKFVSIPPSNEKPTPTKGCIIEIPKYDFDKQYYDFSFVSLLTKKEAIEALRRVKFECNHVSSMSLFQIPVKAMKIDEFEQSQNQQISQTALYLKDSWINKIRTGIRSAFMDFGKGWFNIKEQDWSVYQISKLKKFMELVKFEMQDSLRFLVQDSLVSYTQMVVDSCWQVIDITDDFEWSDKDLINSNIKPKKNALFLIELQIDKNGPRYNIAYENFINTLCGIFEKSITSTQSVPQLEKFVMEDIFFSGTPLLESVGNMEPNILELKETIVEKINKAVIPLKAYSKSYDKYTQLMNLNVDNYIKDFEKVEKTADQVRDEVRMHLREKDILEKLIPSSITIGPFHINTSKIRDNLSNKRKMLAEAILNYQTRKVRIKAEETNNSFRDIQRKLFEKPNTMEELHEHREWMKSIPGLLDDKKEDITSVMEEFALLDEFLYNLSNEDFNMKWSLLSWSWKISNMIIQVEEQHNEDEERFRKLQMHDTASLNEKLDSLIMNVAGMSSHSNLEKAHEVANECRRLNKSLKESQELATLYNNRERLFGIPVTNYEKLTKLLKDFEPFRNLWITSSDWLRWYDSWMNDAISSIDAENIEKNVTEAYKSIHKAIKQFQDAESVQQVAMNIKDQIEEFRPSIPLIQALRNPGMRHRHWEMLTEELKLPVRPKKDLTFKKCLEMGFDRHIDKISKVAEIAGKEYTIEQALNKMKGEWKSIKFEVLPYKNTGTSIIKASDEISQLLDDHIVMTQSMSFSPFKKAFEEDISSWENKLKITQDVLDEWLVCQRSWLYLEPIFSSEDIVRQLPVESKRYQTMERMWRKIMKQAKENPEVISLCPDARLRDQLKECNKLLEQVQKGLSEYLETKRTSFPRFYFLSDDELLEILSKTKDPEAVQPHLRKCFESIYRVKFEQDMRISTMYSAENEGVEFRENIYPTGNVEDWMLEIERVMKESLRQIIRDSLEDYKTKPRTSWVIEWPGQIVIAGCQTYWTTLVSKALEENNLDEYHQKQLKELDDLRVLVRGKLTSKARQTLSALIVIEVHARDVVINLLNEKVSDVNDFEWISQLRAVNAEFLYGYEYLGNSSRLVITPLTDRCYLTLTGALHLKFGGAPAGPAGTGKTETTKDLAKAMAVQCVVFNCSDQLDFMAMGKFFKGLASAGAWACFDEFNRIDIEVLSVVAQQIQQIQQALTQRAERFLFEGVEIALKPSCAVFITMNPGYAGRTELPDNLKALFRPVAMMVPDYALIAEISLFSFGFSDAKTLAKKIVTTFKLSSEQLSSQDHYDFGMRAVKSVISAAGNLKRQNPDMNEELICLRAIRDVNVPKFLQDDLKLFNGIVSDLFPKIKEEPIDYGALESSLRKSCLKLDIKDVDNFILKCIQLYETTVVRHGLMLVGPTGSGKTKCYETLKAAMSSLAGQPSPAGTPFEVVHTYILNPKSITMGQLYGEFDLLTHEWTDGILSVLMGQGVEADNDDKRWYLFDGPVDAVWIENMNTVLDDNKKLCLTNGEIIKMTEAMTMMFEVADLAVASPATVSRCGMVYLEPSILGLKPFVECWIRKLPESVFIHQEILKNLFEIFLEPSIKFIRKNAKEIIPTMDSNLTYSLLKLMDCFLAPYRPKENDKPLSQEAILKLPELLEPWFLFSLIWSVGASCDNDGRIKFNEWLRQKIEKNQLKMPFPPQGLVYDYVLDDGGIFLNEDENKDENEEEVKKVKIINWKNWMTNLPELNLTSDTKFSDIIVPTIDNIRNAYLIEFLLKNDKTVLCVGPTGTGKTLTIADKLARSMPKEYSPEFIVFSAKTSANQTQDLIDSKLDKRRKGIYGPPLGKYFIFFIDDLNMPALEVYGAQPPIELVRQWMDFKGWYDRKAIGEFRHLVDINFCCAMGPPGGGRNPVTARLTRHFNHLSFVEMEETSMTKIFGTILNWWIKSNDKISECAAKLVENCISVYKTISAQLLPTPAKSHYTFNLRDLSKTFQGILMADAKSIETVPQLLRLWYHESCRVFQDRLINDEDRNWFTNLLKDKIKNSFNLEYSEVVHIEPVIYGDFMIKNTETKVYAEINDFKLMKKVIDDSLDEFNAQSQTKTRLVLFMDAMKHISRISRIIRQPFGNALLLGVGGSGRQSLTRLATSMAEYDISQIELSKNYGMSEWREDLKKVMISAGLENKQIVFLFSDTQIKNESFLEDLNNILNSGDVPNIYSLEELDQIYNAMKASVQDAGLPPTKTNLFSAYTKRVRNNLHTVICMSPIGEIFRARLRQFPALVNCCTIDWFSEWPKDALESVAMTFLQEMPDLEASDEVVNGLMNICQEMHQTVVQESIKFKEEQGRYNYVTPTSYLELLSIFSKIFGSKKNELIQARRRTKTGLDKLLSTEKEVTKLRGELEQMQPLLEEAVKEAVSTMETISVDSKVAAETRAIVQNEEEIASKKAKEAKAIADDAQRELDEALPALDAALASLKSLNRNDVVEVKAMKNPPDGVKLVMEAVCIMKKIQPKKIAGDKPGSKVDDYTEPARNILSDPAKFLEGLFTYDKENIPESVIQKIEPYINNDKFLPAAIAQVSKACTSICSWVRAMYKYYFVNKSVEPKREAQRIALEELAENQKSLANAKAKLKEVEEKLATLQAKYDDSVRKKAELEVKVKECEEKVVRAGKLVNGLGEEKIRWAENVKQLEYEISNVIGDVLAASGFIAYLGPFTAQYREQMTSKWIAHLTKYKVPHTESPEVVKTLGDPVKIRNWQLAGLPKDSLSVQNGLIVQYSQRWPLFIDPQGQANKWIKNLEKDNGIDVIKLSDRDFLRSLENAIRFGKPCLLENVSVELDPALEPVLLRLTFKHAGSLVIKLGDAVIPYHEDFKFYITTKLPNPHYTPEVSVKVTLINFTLSPSGLEDQMLGVVVAEERPDLEEAKNQLIISNSIMKNELKEIEDTILMRLSKSENPVDDIELINALEQSKVKSTEIKSKVIVSEQTEKDIDATRSEYVPVSINTQILFFCVSDLANIDPMYQYSLEWFTRIFLNSIQNAGKADTLKERINNINEHFTFNLYTNVCRSLFEKHKLLFAFLLTVRIMMNNKKILMKEYRFFLAGGTSRPKNIENPSPDWISDRAWGEILTLESLASFDTFVEDFKNHLSVYKHIFDASEPHKESLPEKWNSKLDSFQKIIFLKCLRPDRVTNAMQDFVAQNIGQRFIEPQTAELNLVFKDSSPSTPLIFVLSQGTDPAADLYKFAEEMKFLKKLSAISLGQGQGPRAEAMVRGAMERGLWVFFQNCHLAPSWMPSLERLVEQIDPEHVHKDFRLWLTSMPSPKFPVMILQNGSKMTVEPPRGIKANLLKSYTTFNDDFFNSCTGRVEPFKFLLFSLCLFHGVTLERRKFGPLGFNIPYEFTDGDLRICLSQLKMFLMEYSEIPYKVLKYTAGHINYGGRVTDDWDRRCIMNILQDFYNPTVVDENFNFDQSKIYHQLPSVSEHVAYMAYIRSLPINDTPEIFGLHDNANITFAQNETFRTLSDLLQLQPKSLSGVGISREEIMEKTAKDILEKVPKPLNIGEVMEKYPVMYEQSMNTVLVQEIIRYNKLLSVIHKTLQDLLKALKGLVVMSQELEDMSNSLFNNQVPNIWAKVAYPSLKPLAAWVSDLVMRMEFIQNWVANGLPKVYWISGFFFPQAFLTGTLQNYARSKIISIDTISFGFEILSVKADEIDSAPQDGCYIRGLFIEGARWDKKKQQLGESKPKELYSVMPIIWLQPSVNRQQPTSGIYVCPVYKTLTRAGTLSTTGHSTNFVFSVELPSDERQTHWIKRGVAMLCALNY